VILNENYSGLSLVYDKSIELRVSLIRSLFFLKPSMGGGGRALADALVVLRFENIIG
jgi:hypothetical protein